MTTGYHKFSSRNFQFTNSLKIVNFEIDFGGTL